MCKIARLISHLIHLNILKSIHANFKLIPGFRKFTFPIHIYYGVKIKRLGTRKQIHISSECRRLEIGGGGSFNLGHGGYWEVGPNAQLIIHGNLFLSRGIQFIDDGLLEFGKNVKCNSDCIINCGNRIFIGEDCLIGWGTQIIDGDGHEILSEKAKEPKSIVIGKHVWVSSRTNILGGTYLCPDSVVASGTILSKNMGDIAMLVGKINCKLHPINGWKE